MDAFIHYNQSPKTIHESHDTAQSFQRLSDDRNEISTVN